MGAGIARDLTLRGLDTLLLEKEDFSSGTTSRSTRLIHGGLRYLRQLEFGLVRQDMREREVLLRIAPHLVHPLTFLIPIQSTLLNLTMAAGVTLYDIISCDKTLPNHKYLNKQKTLQLEPGLKVSNLQGSYVYYDCQIPYAERLNWETALSAAENGATVVNYGRVIEIHREGDNVTGIKVKDELSGEKLNVRGKMIINAAGHWVDQVKDMIFTNKQPYLLRTKGIHLIIPEVSKNALVLFSPADNRLFFVIPWEGYSLVGTTDTVYTGNLDAVYATNDDVNYLLDGLHMAFPHITMEDVLFTYAGLRSLALKPGKTASDTSRSHEIIDHSKIDGLNGMLTVLGGKITAYRSVAEDVADFTCHKLGSKRRCTTGEIPLPGAPALTQEEIQALEDKYQLENNITNNLARIYGTRSKRVLDLTLSNEKGKNRISPGGTDIIAQIWYSVIEESCLTVSDFMMRRSKISFNPNLGLEPVNTVAVEMKKLLHWNDDEMKYQINQFLTSLNLTQKFKHAEDK